MSVIDSLSAGCDIPDAELANAVPELLHLRRWVDRQLQRACAEAGRNGRDRLTATRQVSSREARAIARRAAVCQRWPAVMDLPAGHLDALGCASERLGAQAERLDPHIPELTERAAQCGPDQFAAVVRALVAELSERGGQDQLTSDQQQCRLTRRNDPASGLTHYTLVLDAESAARVDTQLDAEIRRLWATEQRGAVPDTRSATFDAVAARALVGLLTRGTPAARAGVPELIVIVDYDTLTSGVVGPGAEHRTSTGAVLPPETVRRYACDARIIPALLGSGRASLDVGRAARNPTPAQRAMLRALYPTCAIEGCDVGFDWCHMHHLEHWVNFGPTDLSNLVPLCSHHHHQVHEGGWRLQLDPHDRGLTVRWPDGSIHSVSHPVGTLNARRRARRRRRQPAAA